MAEKVKALVAYIEDINARLGIPATLAGFGIKEALFTENLERMASGAVADPCTGTNPRAINDSEMRQLFKLAYYGK